MFSPQISQVKVNKIESPVLIPITSELKPQISEELIFKWQSLLDLVAQIIKIPAALIMKVAKKEIEVFLSSHTEGNPYEQDEKAPLQSGLYCETVMGTNKKLLVPNALEDEDWKTNPDVELNMISYLGLPLTWPDHEVFGTICVLDSKTNSYSRLYEEFLTQVKNMLEQDLQLLVQKEELLNSLSEKEISLREIHHRLKNNLNSLLLFFRRKAIGITPEEINDLITALSGRMQILISLQETLLNKDDFNDVNLNFYIPDVTNKILELNSENNINLKFSIDDIPININEAILISQIVLELITNSLKYAIESEEFNTIEIRIANKDQDFIQLTYKDNGSGLTTDFELIKHNSYGFQIIEALTRQLSGELNYIQGDNFEMRFTLKRQVYY